MPGIGVLRGLESDLVKGTHILSIELLPVRFVERWRDKRKIEVDAVAVRRVDPVQTVVQDKLFFTYLSNVGASTPEQLYRIEYILNRNVSLRGEYDEMGQIGADLKFRFEFR